MSAWSRILFLAAGWAFVALAVLGVFLPLLPTTPFVLLASSCFIKSSPRWQAWLANSRWFGPPLRDWHEHRAVRRPVKVLAVVVIAAVITASLLRDLHWGVRTLIIVLGAVGLTVVLRLPTVPARGKGPN
jgi:uncharacterized membrane protein YbaN (DUF454 family)